MRFVQADLFTWEPDGRYDVVFMGFWLSHVPAERFRSFWALVAAALAPRGRVFFADDGYRTPDELIEGPASSTIQRRTPDGTAYRIVKVPHEPADLERQLRELGWDITITPTACRSTGVPETGPGPPAEPPLACGQPQLRVAISKYARTAVMIGGLAPGRSAQGGPSPLFCAPSRSERGDGIPSPGGYDAPNLGMLLSASLVAVV